MAEKEKDEVNNNDKPRATVTHVITCSGFPDRIWQEWNESCKHEFGDCRWMKMWMDHLSAKQNNILQTLLAEISTIKSRLDELESKQSSKNEAQEVRTLGAHGKEVDEK